MHHFNDYSRFGQRSVKQINFFTVFRRSPIKGVRLSPYATDVPFLLGRRYHLTGVTVCASGKYFFHIGRKREMNMDSIQLEVAVPQSLLSFMIIW